METYICKENFVRGIRGTIVFKKGDTYKVKFNEFGFNNRCLVKLENGCNFYSMTLETFYGHFKKTFKFGR